jgi:hypothetical protein
MVPPLFPSFFNFLEVKDLKVCAIDQRPDEHVRNEQKS